MIVSSRISEFNLLNLNRYISKYKDKISQDELTKRVHMLTYMHENNRFSHVNRTGLHSGMYINIPDSSQSYIKLFVSYDYEFSYSHDENFKYDLAKVLIDTSGMNVSEITDYLENYFEENSDVSCFKNITRYVTKLIRWMSWMD